MARQKVSRNEPCPCGSGKKYKVCCLRKGIDYSEDDGGRITQTVQLNSEAVSIIEEQKRRFAERFGREPGPNDPLFFDLPPADELQATMAADMRRAGLPPSLVYAFEKTGLIVTESNQHLIPDKDLDEWQAAVEEYEACHPHG